MLLISGNMTTSNGHFLTTFKNSCVARPRHPDTRLPVTSNETVNEDNGSIGTGYQNKKDKLAQSLLEIKIDEELERNRLDCNELNGNALKERSTTDKGKSNLVSYDQDLSNLLQDDEKFYRHLKALRHENKRTLKMMGKFYYTRPQEKTPKIAEDLISKMKQEADSEESHLFVHKVYDSITNSNQEDNDSNPKNLEVAEDQAHNFTASEQIRYISSSESEEDPRKQWSRHYTENILPDDSEENFRGRAFSYDVIDNMWENFSVEDYAPVERSIKDNSPKNTKWSPSITIPKPFQMTLREAYKAKIKSKRKEKLEQELLEKKLTEEAELNKKFKAKPLPASTFINLYAEKKVIEEQKREYKRSLNKAILEATQKPFSFVKREEEKNELRRSQSLERMNRQLSNEDSKSFKAAPYPEKLFNLSLEDRIAEQEEYRKIKMKMRAQEMLASASLPPNMQARGQRYKFNKRYTKLQEKSSKPPKGVDFKPRINHDIPDYEEMHKKIEAELARKRTEQSPTICEPFNFQTSKVPTRRSRQVESWTTETQRRRSHSYERSRESSLERPQSSSGSLQKSRTSSTQEEAPPFAMTETARLRHLLRKSSIDKKAKEEEDRRQKAERRKRRENQLKKEVARKSIGNDMRHVLERQNKETMIRFKESEIERKKAYKQYLRDIQAKVEQRPLLFEQESQTNAKRLAQRKYKQILQDAGLDDDVVEGLVNSDGKIIDAESDDDTDELFAESDEADQSPRGENYPRSGDPDQDEPLSETEEADPDTA